MTKKPGKELRKEEENLHWCSFEGNQPFYKISEASVDKPQNINKPAYSTKL